MTNFYVADTRKWIKRWPYFVPKNIRPYPGNGLIRDRIFSKQYSSVSRKWFHGWPYWFRKNIRRYPGNGLNVGRMLWEIFRRIQQIVNCWLNYLGSKLKSTDNQRKQDKADNRQPMGTTGGTWNPFLFLLPPFFLFYMGPVLSRPHSLFYWAPLVVCWAPLCFALGLRLFPTHFPFAFFCIFPSPPWSAAAWTVSLVEEVRVMAMLPFSGPHCFHSYCSKSEMRIVRPPEYIM